jgi:hypothetical protein
MAAPTGRQIARLGDAAADLRGRWDFLRAFISAPCSLSPDQEPEVSEGRAKPPVPNRMRLLEGGAGRGGELSSAAPGRLQGRRRAALPTATGLSFDPLLPFEAWSAIGARIARHSSATTWWLGDWLVYGQAKYGRRYKEAIAATGLDYQTLRNYAVVARRFEVSRRRAGLSFHHHAELCALADAVQDRWLDAACAEGWTRNELRRRLRSRRMLAAGPSRVLRVEVSGDREQRWRQAAEAGGRTLEEWITLVLDDAASGRRDH